MIWRSENEVIESYGNWLSDEAIDVNKGTAVFLSDDSIKSYRSYVKNAFVKVITLHNNEVDILKIANAYICCDESDRPLIKSYLDEVLKEERMNPSALVSPRTIGNYISGLNMFFIFLDSVIANNEYEDSKSSYSGAEYLLNSVIRVHSLQKPINIFNKKEMINKMMSKFNTEDRGKFTTAPVSYPIRLISKIMTNCGREFKDELKKWKLDLLNEMEILVSEDGQFVLFKDVEQFIIKADDALYIELSKGGKKQVFTRDDKEHIEPFLAKKKGDISRDHKIALKNCMTDLYHQGAIPSIADLTSLIDKAGLFAWVPVGKKNNKKMKITLAPYMNRFLQENPNVTTPDYAEELLSELKKVLPIGGDQHSLELMKTEYNIQKNDKQ